MRREKYGYCFLSLSSAEDDAGDTCGTCWTLDKTANSLEADEQRAPMRQCGATAVQVVLVLVLVPLMLFHCCKMRQYARGELLGSQDAYSNFKSIVAVPSEKILIKSSLGKGSVGSVIRRTVYLIRSSAQSTSWSTTTAMRAVVSVVVMVGGVDRWWVVRGHHSGAWAGSTTARVAENNKLVSVDRSVREKKCHGRVSHDTESSMKVGVLVWILKNNEPLSQ